MTGPVKDPFSKPHLFNTPDDGPVARTLSKLGLAEPVLIATPTTGRQVVQGAVVGPPCALCDTHVWLAPSSQANPETWKSVLCLPCLYRSLSPDDAVALTKQIVRDARGLFGPKLS